MVLEHGLYNVSSSRQNLRTPLLIDFLPLLRIVQNKVVRASVTLSLPFPSIRIIFYDPMQMLYHCQICGAAF
jgi:hypothetical protein